MKISICITFVFESEIQAIQKQFKHTKITQELRGMKTIHKLGLYFL